MSGNIVNLAARRAPRDDHFGLNERELVSVNALLSYTAYEGRVDEEIVRKAVMRKFEVDEVKKLPSKVFDSVIRYLVDLQVEMIAH
jgi:hypothetical protein